MKTIRLFVLCSVFVAMPVFAAKPCDELRGEIDAKIRANGVPEFTLEVIDAAGEAGTDGKVVGSCEGGSKRIVYRRGAAAAAVIADPAPASEEVAPTAAK